MELPFLDEPREKALVFDRGKRFFNSDIPYINILTWNCFDGRFVHGLQIEFKNSDLDRLETDSRYTAGFGPDIVKAFRRRIQAIRAANDERDIVAVRGNNFEKLKGDRSHQYSMRLNNQWRLILQIKKAAPGNIVVVIDIEDYH